MYNLEGDVLTCGHAAFEGLAHPYKQNLLQYKTGPSSITQQSQMRATSAASK